MLTLFDIDGTILRTFGLGIRAMGAAGRGLYGESFDESAVQFAGRLDPLIITDLLEANAVDASAGALASFRDAYREQLESMLLGEPAKLCPGVHELVDALDRHGAMTLGLLTGNFPETGELKLRSGGIDPNRFPVRVWGEDSPHDPPSRDHLPHVGFARYLEYHERDVDPADVVIIGDTPEDVRCATATGCRCVAVGTGRYSVDELMDAGADIAVEDLSDTRSVAGWITREALKSG